MAIAQFTGPIGAAPGLSSHIVQLLQRAEDLLNRAETGEALGIIAQAKKCMELAAKPAARVVTDADALALSRGYDILLEADSFLNVLTDALHDRLEDKSCDYTNVLDAARAKLQTVWQAMDYAGFNTCAALRLEQQEADHV